MIKPEPESNKSEAVTPVGSGTVLAAPVRRHPDCAESDCQICMTDHHYLGLYIGLKSGGSMLTDWLGKYRTWLDKKGIPAEVNGWASRQAFDEKNVSAFIEDWCS